MTDNVVIFLMNSVASAQQYLVAKIYNQKSEN